MNEASKFPGYRPLQLKELQTMQLNAMKDIHSACVNNNISYYIIGGTLLGSVRHGGFIPWDDDIDIAMLRPDFERFKKAFESSMDQSKYFLQHFDSDLDFRPAIMRVCIKNTILDFSCESHWRYCKNVYIDIFPLDNVPDDPIKAEKQDKELQRRRQIIRRKLYRIHDENSWFKILSKKIVALAYSVIPLKIAQHRVVDIMTKYNDEQTENVCSMSSHYSYKKQNMPRSIYGTPQLVKFEDTELYAPEMIKEYLEKIFGSDYMKLPPVEARDIPCNSYIKV